MLELFTSQGCSSCPPADAWLSGLVQRSGLWREVIPLAFHVDYWDRIGWKDRFANPGYSERQRDYWLGWLHAQKRINPHTYRQDPSLRRLIDVVSFGIPGEDPAHKREVLKGVHPKIAGDDKLIIWSGGMWDWLYAEPPFCERMSSRCFASSRYLSSPVARKSLTRPISIS